MSRDADPTLPFVRVTPPPVPWRPASDLEPPRQRLARGSAAPPSLPADDADATAPRARLIALIEPEPAVSVPLDGPAPADQTSTTVVPLPRGDHFGVLVVVALGLLAVGLGWLLLA